MVSDPLYTWRLMSRSGASTRQERLYNDVDGANATANRALDAGGRGWALLGFTTDWRSSRLSSVMHSDVQDCAESCIFTSRLHVKSLPSGKLHISVLTGRLPLNIVSLSMA